MTKGAVLKFFKVGVLCENFQKVLAFAENLPLLFSIIVIMNFTIIVPQRFNLQRNNEQIRKVEISCRQNKCLVTLSSRNPNTGIATK